MADRTVRIYPSQLRPGDYWYVTDNTRPGAYGNGRRYRVTVVEDPESTRPGWFSGKPQVSVRVRGGVPVFHSGERAESFYRGKRIDVHRP